MEIIPQSSVIGAEVRGLDLSLQLDDSRFEQLHQAFLDHQVLFLRDQRLAPQQYNDFAARFGRLKEYLFAEGMDGFPSFRQL